MTKIFHIPAIFKKVIPLRIAIIIVLLIPIGNYFFSKRDIKAPVKTAAAVNCDENLQLTETKEHALTHPLLIVETPEESRSLYTLKTRMEATITSLQKEKKVKNASVFFVKLTTGDWTGVNENDKYYSSGYIRLAMLITYLKMAESEPSLLARRIWFGSPGVQSSDKKGFVLPGEKYYSVNELLQYMMLYPDTNAKSLLMSYLNKEAFEKLFLELGMDKPDLNNRKFSITPKQYSKFLHLLFNARYLNETNSELAMQLLADAPDKKGMVKVLPSDIKVVHKYGERFMNNAYELRESGIIYGDNVPYLVTIFGTSSSSTDLESVSQEIAKDVYGFVSEEQ